MSNGNHNNSVEIYVCQSGTCRRKGSDAALVEIEELANLFLLDDDNSNPASAFADDYGYYGTETKTNHDLRVTTTGCLGYCSEGPAVAVVSSAKAGRRRQRNSRSDSAGRQSQTRYHTGVSTLEKSASVVESATQQKLPYPLDDLPPETESRLSVIRATKQREYLVQTYQWNKALASLLRAANERKNYEQRRFWTNGTVGSNNSETDPGSTKRLWTGMEEILVRAGYPSSVTPKDLSGPLPPPTETIESYVLWTLDSVEPVSEHSAVFRFRTRDAKRGTPHPRGRGRVPKPVTWHVTLLGGIVVRGGGVGNDQASLPPHSRTNRICSGEDHREGPLPWIERDYTPISSALEWERGTCDILIKIYNDGKVTSWLDQLTKHAFAPRAPNESRNSADPNNNDDGNNNITNEPNHTKIVLYPKTSRSETKLYLSKPIPTLSVPTLALDGDTSSTGTKPASILLLLAGTGIVAAPQVLAHQEPARLLGISTPRGNQLLCPIDLVHSCRDDDLLCLQEIRAHCLTGLKSLEQQQQQQSNNRRNRGFKGLRHYTLLVSESSSSSKKSYSNDSNGNSQVADDPSPPPFRDAVCQNSHRRTMQKDYRDVFAGVPNAEVSQSRRLNESVIRRALERLIPPYRIVVSGPDAYNTAARELLEACRGIDDASTQLTVLSA